MNRALLDQHARRGSLLAWEEIATTGCAGFAMSIHEKHLCLPEKTVHSAVELLAVTCGINIPNSRYLQHFFTVGHLKSRCQGEGGTLTSAVLILP